MASEYFQDNYPDETAYCFGCGRLNGDGHHVRSRWSEDDPNVTIAIHRPDPKYTAIPGFVYGGLLASLVDCHGTGTAAGAAYRAAGREMGTQPSLRFVTASLHVDFLRPTPQGVDLVLRGVPTEVKERKVVVDITLSADGVDCVKGQVVAVLAPDSMFATMDKS